MSNRLWTETNFSVCLSMVKMEAAGSGTVVTPDAPRTVKAGRAVETTVTVEPDRGAGRSTGTTSPISGGAGQVLPRTRVPPAVVEVRAGRPLADQQRVTGAVADVGAADARIDGEHAVARPQVSPRDAEVRRQPDAQVERRVAAGKGD